MYLCREAVPRPKSRLRLTQIFNKLRSSLRCGFLMASNCVANCSLLCVLSVSPLYASCSATQYTVCSVLKKDESFDSDRSLHFVYSSNCDRGVHTHCTVNSFASDNINTASVRSRAVSNTNVVLSHCVHCIELCMYRSSSAVCVTVSQYASLGMCACVTPCLYLG